MPPGSLESSRPTGGHGRESRATIELANSDDSAQPKPAYSPPPNEISMQLTHVTKTVKAPASRFTGDVYVTPIKKAEASSRLSANLVRFTPGARTNWHSHAFGQTLHVTEGVGLVVGRDGTVIRVRAGDTVWTSPGEEHWHGGTNSNILCHISMLESTDDGDGTTWLEPVADDEYPAAQEN